MRKEADYSVSDRISLSIAGEGSRAIIDVFGDYIVHETLSRLVSDIAMPDIEKIENIAESIDLTIRIQR